VQIALLDVVKIKNGHLKTADRLLKEECLSVHLGRNRQSESFFPLGLQVLLQSLFEIPGHFVGLTIAVERNRLSNIVNDNLARVAAGKVLRKFLADLCQLGSVYVLV
jgi:hypothetical protein